MFNYINRFFYNQKGYVDVNANGNSEIDQELHVEDNKPLKNKPSYSKLNFFTTKAQIAIIIIIFTFFFSKLGMQQNSNDLSPRNETSYAKDTNVVISNKNSLNSTQAIIKEDDNKIYGNLQSYAKVTNVTNDVISNQKSFASPQPIIKEDDKKKDDNDLQKKTKKISLNKKKNDKEKTIDLDSFSDDRNTSQKYDLKTTQPRIFIHYHKTGNFLTHDIMSLIKTYAGINPTQNDGGKSRSYVCNNDMHVKPNSFFVQTAPLLLCENLTNVIPKSTSILHFVRNPYDMIISSYVYHMQIPTPEIWIKNQFSFNAYRLLSLGFKITFEAIKLGLDKDLGVTLLNYNNIVSVWEEHLPKTNKIKNIPSLYTILHRLSLEDGIRFWAARTIVLELWAMVHNIMMLEKDKSINHFAVGMEDWIHHMNETGVRAMKFILPHKSPNTRANIVNSLIKKFKKNKKSTNHITQNKISSKEKKKKCYKYYNKIKF